MNVAKWLLISLLALPFMELAVFIVVSAAIGFGWALTLILVGSLAGALVLRHAGGNHIARIRVALGEGSFTALQADSRGSLTLIAGFLLLIPGFITDFVALLLLAGSFGRSLLGHSVSPVRSDGVVDLTPEQWRQVPDPALPDRRQDDGRRKEQ
jgi:UPF0716 protein FxsA